MAVFGYIIYICACFWVSLFTLAAWSWPGSAGVERLISVVIFGLVWYGAYSWAPFKMVSV